mmetsp:Transcript_19923/g.14376  ORF Transcript_19923/g.14376 Transcript_19923/m.14376 type:complete len:150 (+) Transcript_19923:285-734(+)
MSVDSEISNLEPSVRRTFQVNTVFDKKDKDRRFVGNEIRTTKYTWWNFFPKNLFYQFTKAANLYFMALMLMQCYPPISDSGGKPVILAPILFVVGASMIKDAIEHKHRAKSDYKENMREVTACVPGGDKLEIMTTKSITVGSIVKIYEN